MAQKSTKKAPGGKNIKKARGKKQPIARRGARQIKPKTKNAIAAHKTKSRLERAIKAHIENTIGEKAGGKFKFVKANNTPHDGKKKKSKDAVKGTGELLRTESQKIMNEAKKKRETV